MPRCKGNMHLLSRHVELRLGNVGPRLKLARSVDFFRKTQELRAGLLVVRPKLNVFHLKPKLIRPIHAKCPSRSTPAHYKVH
jgi:hypothetical protein